MTRRSLIIGALCATLPLTGHAKRRTEHRYGIKRPPHGCTLQRVYEDGSAYARCKDGKAAGYDPDRKRWRVFRRHS